MTNQIMYLLESSAVLAFLYLLYVLVLRKETFFSLNRFFLLGILIFSLLFPFLSFDFNPARVVAVERPIEEISKFRMSYYDAMASWEFENRNDSAVVEDTGVVDSLFNSSIDWSETALLIFLVLYIIGIGVCLSRTLWTLRWIWKLISTHPQSEIDGVKIVHIPDPITPFSFLKYVFVHDSSINTPEFDQILEHEKTHIQEHHSIDLIFVQLLAAFFWFNPVIWRLIKSLKTTHEYIADKKIINAGYSLVEYQTLLLRQLISNNSYGLVHNFNLSFIKKRITMMKNKKSGWSGKVKVAMTVASTIIFAAVIVQCNSNIEEQASLDFEKVSNDDFAAGINLPVLPRTGFKHKGDLTDALNFTIVGNELTIDEEHYDVDEIGSMIAKSGLTEQGVIVVRIDAAQPMELVREVSMELRKADRRKLLYLGQSNAGEKVEMAFLLPPSIENNAKSKTPLPEIDDEYIAITGIDVMKIKLGGNEGERNQVAVYDFVMKHVKKNSSNYVVSAHFDDNDTYDDYLVNLTYIQEGFNQIYQERAQELFGKDFYDLEKPDYHATRKGIPRAISVAEGGPSDSK